ncbi:MAG: hypothetical protein IT385_14385 [Deltaproteobacteria bacterium]|nr:hypothetical protein [Deltaproteobacteria bacterium]
MSADEHETSLAETRHTLHARLMRFARHGEGAFDELARDVAAYQARALPAYGRLVAASGPEALTHWTRVPPVPTELFAELDLCSLPPSSGERVFMTSGTTQGAARRGRRRAPDLALYDAAMAGPFIDAVLGGDRTPRRWVSLVPRADIMPTSSLSYMVTGLAEALASETTWCLDREGLDANLARPVLAEGEGPIIILTTALALVDLLAALNEPPRMPRMPPGSRIMLTGGFKGRSDAITEAELLDRVRRQLGIPAERVIPEYGMTELTSQAYGRPLAPMPSLRFRVVDPATGDDLPPGEEGLVACFDLLNLDNVSAILTSDLGVLDASGRLELRGRLAGSMPRGCSLTAEELRRVVAG